MSIAAASVLVVLVLAAAFCDVRTRRIPNALTGTLAAAGLAFRIPLGPHAFGASVLAILVVFIAGTAAFNAGWFGGGDVKLLSGCAGFSGLEGLVTLVLAVLIAGGLLSAVVALRRRGVVPFLRSTAGAAVGFAPAQPILVPYGVAIAAGAVCSSVLSIAVR